MPTYEYECGSCHRVFEVRQRISASPLATCDACGGPVRRLLSAAPFILKGDGWYVTDYPSESRRKAREAEKSSSGASDKPAEKSDAKPETKSSDAKSETKSSDAKSDGSGTSAASSRATTPTKAD